MKRARAMLIGFGLVLSIGCGVKSYDYRIGATLDRMRYEDRLNQNLTPAARGKIEELGIYIRPPKNLTGPTQAFQFAALEPGRFDLENTFLESDLQSLHVLARVERPKAAAKKDEPAQPEAAPRGDFNEEVVELVRNATGAEVDLSQFKQETKQAQGRRQANNFLTLTIPMESKDMQVYLYGTKASAHKVALIFEYAKAQKNVLTSRINLSLENFAVGDQARQAFSGGLDDGDDDGGTGEPGPPI